MSLTIDSFICTFNIFAWYGLSSLPVEMSFESINLFKKVVAGPAKIGTTLAFLLFLLSVAVVSRMLNLAKFGLLSYFLASRVKALGLQRSILVLGHIKVFLYNCAVQIRTLLLKQAFLTLLW